MQLIIAWQILKTRGNVLPVSNTPMKITAKFEDGSIVHGESNIPKGNGRIMEISYEDSEPEILPGILYGDR